MDIEEQIKWTLDTGTRVQERAQFYSLTLSFTLLALSVQTANISDDKFIAISESIGAIALLISGLAGLWRLLNIPLHYKIQVMLLGLDKIIEEEERDLNHIKQTKNIESILKKYTDDEGKDSKYYVAKRNKLSRNLKILMIFHKYSLLAGIITLMISRLFYPTYKTLYGCTI